MAARITIEVNDEQIATALDRVADAGLNPQPLFDDIGASMVVSTQQRFLTETDPSGRKWQRHAKSTVRRRGAGAPILRDRNLLFRSLTHNATGGYVEWGTNRVDGGIHQFGGTIQQYARSQKASFAKNRKGKWRFAKHSDRRKSKVTKHITIAAHAVTIPARPYLGVDAEDRKLILDMIETYVTNAAEGGQ